MELLLIWIFQFISKHFLTGILGVLLCVVLIYMQYISCSGLRADGLFCRQLHPREPAYKGVG